MSATLSSKLLPEDGGRPVPPALALSQRIGAALGSLAPAVDLLIRVLVASVFFKSGLTKIAGWESTLSLFENEYAVPLLPPEVAAFVGAVDALRDDVERAAVMVDRLAARVAQMISADCLVILSDVDGLYSADPTIDPEATVPSGVAVAAVSFPKPPLLFS